MLGYNDGAVGTPMQLIDELRAEHDVIDQVAGAFLTSGLLDAVAAGLEGGEASEAGFRESATAYVHALWHHIDAENSVLFPECGPRLRRNGVMELRSRPMAPDEHDAMSAGRALVARYPAPAHPDVMRGDGCIMCPAFAVTCRGLELEWWNEWEWDEFEDRMSGG